VDLGAIARGFRALRIRRRLTQQELADLAGVSRSIVSRIERGLLRNIQLGDIADIAAALGATADLRIRWNGESLDRLLDEAHAALVERVVTMLEAMGWECLVEVTFSIYGERGSIDVLALHRIQPIALLIEVKSIVPDSQAMLLGVDRKERLLPRILADRGRNVSTRARLLVIGDSSTSRRRIARLGTTFGLVFPVRGRDVERWLREPNGAMSGLMFLASAPRVRDRRASVARQRVRRSSCRAQRSRSTTPGRPAAATALVERK
jgi:transcriptional regulator with XRE-family HTH domain